METKFFSKASDFLSEAGGILLQDEVKYGLILGIAGRLIDDPHAYGEPDPWFCTLTDDIGVCAVAMRTPLHKVLLAHFSGDPAVNATKLAEAISTTSKNIPGVTGEKEIAGYFIEHWCKTHSTRVVGSQAQRIYRLERIRDIKFASGKLRMATLADRALIVKWAHAFHQDVYPSTNLNVPESDVVPKILRKEVYVWVNPVPVSMVGKASPTENGVRIGLVYTPPEFRGKGFATSCVASLCRQLLGSGFKYCMLYTDLANPTSNSVYQKIGFIPVCDSVEYAIENR
jgi:predicted GNAT family acetyltransferase